MLATVINCSAKLHYARNCCRRFKNCSFGRLETRRSVTSPHISLLNQSYHVSRLSRKFDRHEIRFSSVTSDLTEIEDATSNKSVEEQYSRKTPLEHVLLRPGMYVGPVERSPPISCWVPNPLPKGYDFSIDAQESILDNNEGRYKMKSTEYGLVPALVKIFDEILVNASDNRLRHPKTCNRLDVRIDPGSATRDAKIRIWNNGKGIPIQVHKHEGIYGKYCSGTIIASTRSDLCLRCSPRDVVRALAHWVQL